MTVLTVGAGAMPAPPPWRRWVAELWWTARSGATYAGIAARWVGRCPREAVAPLAAVVLVGFLAVHAIAAWVAEPRPFGQTLIPPAVALTMVGAAYGWARMDMATGGAERRAARKAAGPTEARNKGDKRGPGRQRDGASAPKGRSSGAPWRPRRSGLPFAGYVNGSVPGYPDGFDESKLANAPMRSVSLTSLHSINTGGYLNHAKARYNAQHRPHHAPIWVVAANGRYYVIDGHHRAVGDYWRGQSTTRAHVYTPSRSTVAA